MIVHTVNHYSSKMGEKEEDHISSGTYIRWSKTAWFVCISCQGMIPTIIHVQNYLVYFKVGTFLGHGSTKCRTRVVVGLLLNSRSEIKHLCSPLSTPSYSQV